MWDYLWIVLLFLQCVIKYFPALRKLTFQKKVLSLANGIIEASGGVLLIDEIDTSVHYKYYADIFGFLIKAAAKFNVQLFITTHSEEAILELLKTQNYELETPPKNDIINVITFR